MSIGDKTKYVVLTSVGTASLLILSLSNCSEASRRQGLSNRPNIILLFADDLGYGDLSCYGHPTIRTIHLDRMAQNGLRFTSFYSAAPVCTPSRAALLTGRYPMRCGLPRNIGPDSKHGLPLSEKTVADILKAGGYRTKAIGKWHLGHGEKGLMATSRGFDEHFGLLYSNDMIPPWVQTQVPLRLYRDLDPIEGEVDQNQLTVRYTTEALEFISRPSEDPFFLYLAYSMPHLPVRTTDAFRGQSDAGLYGDVIQTIDWSAGQILSKLNERELSNTLVVFTSDNGPWLNLPARMLQKGNLPWHAGSPGLLRGAKATTYEGGMRVPAIIWWPERIGAGRVTSDMASTLDLFPTFVEAAGAESRELPTLDGYSLLGLLEDRDRSPRQDFYYFRGDILEAVREDNWKYRLSSHPAYDEESVEPSPLEPELYMLDVDPSEKYNVVESHPEIVARLDRKLRQFAKDLGAVVESTDGQRP